MDLRHVIALLSFASFSCNDGSADRCTSSGDCNAGEVCFDGICKLVCVESRECPVGWSCVNGVCEPGTHAGAAPEIFEVDGTGTIDGQSHRFTDRIVVTGRNLLGAIAALTGPEPANTVYPLQACITGTETEMTLGLPPSLVAGDYTLTVANQAGGTCTGLSILKGEDGTDGSLLDGDLFYVNVDGDVMTGDLTISGYVAIWTEGSSASLSARATNSEQLTGVVTATGADAEVTGVGTSFTTELEVGDAVAIEGVVYAVTAIAGDLSMTVTPQPTAFLNANAFAGGPILELQDLSGATRVLVDRRGRFAQLDVLGNLDVSGAVACTECVDSADVEDGTLTNADVASNAAIAASKIDTSGLDADSVDGREPTVGLYACPASCTNAPGTSAMCPCVTSSQFSFGDTVSCTGSSGWNLTDGCIGSASSNCDCSLVGYLMSP